LGVARLDNLVYVNYNMKLTERFKTKKLLVESGSKKYDPLVVNEFNLMSEWLTGIDGACNEWVYTDEGLTWADVETAAGATEHPGPSTRSGQARPFTSQVHDEVEEQEDEEDEPEPEPEP